MNSSKTIYYATFLSPRGGYDKNEQFTICKSDHVFFGGVNFLKTA